MLIAINQQGEQVYAHRAKKQDDYFCRIVAHNYY